MSDNTGARVTLKGTSQHGKNRVREHGSDWELIELRRSVPALDGGGGAFLKSPRTGDLRWVKLENDPNFEVTGLPEGEI